MRIDGWMPRICPSPPREDTPGADAPGPVSATRASANEQTPDDEATLRAASHGASLAAWASRLDPANATDRDDLPRLEGLVDQIARDLLGLATTARPAEADEADPPAHTVDVLA